MKTRITAVALASVLCLMIVFPIVAAAEGAPKEPMGNLLMILTTDDPETFDGGLLMAGVAAKRGHKVTLLIRIKAVRLVLNDRTFKIGDTTITDKLTQFMKSGSTVMVGGGCMKMYGLSKDKLIPGVVVGTPDVVMGMIFDPDTRIISH